MIDTVVQHEPARADQINVWVQATASHVLHHVTGAPRRSPAWPNRQDAGGHGVLTLWGAGGLWALMQAIPMWIPGA